METAVQKLKQLALGSRVVVRYRIDGGLLTDALGFLTAVDDATCTVQTRSGDVVVPLADVRAAKAVPPAPPPRAGRRPLP